MNKIGRNDPCPCGSGKKYKACCAGGQAPRQSSQRERIAGLMEQALYLCQSGYPQQAEDLYRDVLALQPAHADALNNLGMIAIQSGRTEEACDWFQRAAKARPEHAIYHLNLGNVLQDLRRNYEAKQAFQRCIKLKPDLAEAYNNLANLLQQEFRLLDALAMLNKALALKPDFAEALNNLGAVHKDLGELEQASACFRRALQLKPDYETAHNNLLFALNYAPRLDPEQVYEEHVRFGQRFAIQPRPPAHPGAGRKLKIGYVSGDLRKHTVSFFIEPILRHHDRARFEIFAYCNNAADEVTERLQKLADGWRDIRHLNSRQAAQLVRDDGVDILIDLAGHTAHNRLDVFAQRAAPLQVTWLGYFNTTGLPAIDCLISDPVSSPTGDAQRFSETVLRLPQVRLCYQAPDYAPAPAELPALRNGYVTFGSFNTLTKLNREVIALWSKVLAAVPGSRLLLKSRGFDEPALQKWIAERFAQHGIGAERLSLRTHSAHADMLGEYGDMDIALDPLPFNGGLTTCEALWQGVPVLTLQGESLIGRQSASFLAALGMRDWIAATPEEYVARAATHAAQLPALAQLRAGLREAMRASAICDAARFTGELEQLLMDAYDKLEAAPTSRA